MLKLLRGVVCAPRCVSCGQAGPRVCSTCAGSWLPSPEPCTESAEVRVLTALSYEGSARDAVLSLKLEGQRGAAEPLVRAMVETVWARGLRAALVTWVPGRAPDIRLRGFDHAFLLAEGLARELGLPLAPLLSRQRAGEDQSGLSRLERWANTEGAFRGRPSSSAVVVVDDLVTTGATASAAAVALQSAGAPGVEVLAACRATRPD